MRVDFLEEFEFFSGVPDSLLKPISTFLMNTHGIGKEHIIAANEGNAVALAAGYYLATGKVPVVYLQNSGLGNIINPVASLLNERVYGIPCVFIVGWRGEPGVKDEPQHVFQGQITEDLLKTVGIETFIVDKTTARSALDKKLEEFSGYLSQGKQVAFLVRKGVLDEVVDTTKKIQTGNISREDAIRVIVEEAGDDPIVCTTGKASRELFEIREEKGQGHERDFLTVGSMGHSSSIALGIALHKPDRRVWCLDGDGAVLMHMGSMAVIGSMKPENYIHILLNNGAHESVGGMPTVGNRIDFGLISKGCGYQNYHKVSFKDDLSAALKNAKEKSGLTLVEVMCEIGARDSLGRPTTTAKENGKHFGEFLHSSSSRQI